MITNEVEEIVFPQHLSDSSRVWIYQAMRNFSPEETSKINELCEAFTTQWAAHGQNLTATHAIYFDRFLCLFVDESAHGASGCSIDSSVRFIQNLEREMGIELMNRTQVAYLEGDKVRTIEFKELPAAVESGLITPKTRVFNNTVNSKKDMQNAWIAPASDTWVSRYF